MAWNSIEMANKFLTRANAIHPEEEDNESARVSRQAVQDFYYECYMASFDRGEFIKFLESAISGVIKIPKDLNEATYRAAFTKEADSLLRTLKA